MLLTLLIKQEENSADSLSVAKPRGSDPPISADRTSILRPSALPAGQDWWPEGCVPFASCRQHKMRARGGKNSQEKVNQPTIRMSPKKSSNNPGTPPNLETTPNAEMARRPSAFSLARAAQGKSYPTGKKDQSLTQNAHPTLRAVTNTGTPINLGQLPIQTQQVSRATPGPED